MKKASSGDQRLSSIRTFWAVVGKAKGQTAESTAAAQQLIERYSAAVHRYLLGAVRDADVADDLAQEFALRFMRGDLQKADPERGRFRDFVKGVLFHLIADHYRKLKRMLPPLQDGSFQDCKAANPSEDDRQFLESWRTELLNRAWAGLEKVQTDTGQLFYSVLRQRAEHPEQRSAEMAEQLSTSLGKVVNAAWVRQMLHRARDKFADLLLDETLQTLQEPTVDDLEREIIDLGLFEYCREALERMRAK